MPKHRHAKTLIELLRREEKIQWRHDTRLDP